MSVEIVAEPGATHDKDLQRMLETIHMAAGAGVSSFKNQWLSDPTALVRRRNAGAYARSYDLLGYPLAWHEMAGACARDLGLRYGCSVYLPGDAALVAPHVDFLKVASFEAETSILQECFATGRPVVVSVGMTDDAGAYAIARQLRPDDTVLHCVSAYPTPVEEMNLAVIGDLREKLWADGRFCRVGFSDHSGNMSAGGGAVAAGAEVVEVHCCLDDATGPDTVVALRPEALTSYVANIRMAARARGDGIKRVTASERAMQDYKVREALS